MVGGILFRHCQYIFTTICSSHFVALLVSVLLLLQYLMQGFEIRNMVQICIEHRHKGNRISIPIIIAELCPLKWHLTIFCALYVAVVVYTAVVLFFISSTPPIFDHISIPYVQHYCLQNSPPPVYKQNWFNLFLQNFVPFYDNVGYMVLLSLQHFLRYSS